ncbi:MAG: hypothetical protein GXP38_02590 [Chloroflexi bacterium]|nr:hypothetical protein [Chloroflexota bacterium]
MAHPSLILQRIYRGIDALLTPYRPIDDTPAQALLPPSAYQLYLEMSKTDRAHSLRLLAWLQTHGYEQPDLLQAALLHDVGKAQANLWVWQRTLKVILRRLWPRLWYWLARPVPPDSWRFPFYVLQAHPQIGAEQAQQVGCNALTCWLIRYHETDLPLDHPKFALHQALQRADSAS